MKETKRQRQVAELVRRNFSTVLQSEGSYIYGSAPLVTVTQVNMSPDLGIAKIHLSIWNAENKQAVMLSMQEEQTRLRQALGQRLKRHLRRIPHIDFYEDETLDEMYKVDNMFDKLHDEDQMGEEGATESEDNVE